MYNQMSSPYRSFMRKYSALVSPQVAPPVYILREELTGSSQAILRLDLPAEFGGTLPYRRTGRGLTNRLRQSFCREGLKGKRGRPNAQSMNPSCPTGLIGSQGRENRGNSAAQSCARRPPPTLMHHGRHPRKKPAMRQTFRAEDVRRHRAALTNAGPAAEEHSTLAGQLERPQD